MLAGNFAVTLPIVTCLSTVKMYLCVLINVLVAVFLTVAQSVCTLCNFRCRFRHICSNVTVCFGYIYCEKVFVCFGTVFAVLFCGCRGQGELLRYSPFFSATQRIKALHGATRCQTSCNLQKFSSSDGLYSPSKGVGRGTSACDKIRLLVKNKRGFVNLTKGAVRCTIPLQTYRE